MIPAPQIDLHPQRRTEEILAPAKMKINENQDCGREKEAAMKDEINIRTKIIKEQIKV